MLRQVTYHELRKHNPAGEVRRAAIWFYSSTLRLLFE
jgi:hypothetical protein